MIPGLTNSDPLLHPYLLSLSFNVNGEQSSFHLQGDSVHSIGNWIWTQCLRERLHVWEGAAWCGNQRKKGHPFHAVRGAESWKQRILMT